MTPHMEDALHHGAIAGFLAVLAAFAIIVQARSLPANAVAGRERAAMAWQGMPRGAAESRRPVDALSPAPRSAPAASHPRAAGR